MYHYSRGRGIPRLYAAASLKHLWVYIPCHPSGGIPRLYAAASLKPDRRAGRRLALRLYSAALCRGLIEAKPPSLPCVDTAEVFRGSMPRPH